MGKDLQQPQRAEQTMSKPVEGVRIENRDIQNRNRHGGWAKAETETVASK